MTEDDPALSPEIAEWLKARQSKLQVVKSTTTRSGQTLDWVPIESQSPSGKIAKPPPPIKLAEPGPSKWITRPASFELDDPSVEHGPAGTVPILRPNEEGLARFKSLSDLLSHTKKGGRRIGWHLKGAGAVDPDPDGYFHCQISENGVFYGWEGRLNVWDPQINNPGPGDDHSILQAWVLNDALAPRQSLEGGWSVDQSLNGDTQPHIFTYFTTNNYAQDGDYIGGYNTKHKGFMQFSSPTTTGSVVYPGIALNEVSVAGGAQVDLALKFQLILDAGTGELNWWIAVQGIWMGYYPAGLYGAGGMSTSADLLSCGGEVFSGLPNPEATNDQMGSGVQAAAGWTQAAYLGLLSNQIDMAGTLANSNGIASNDPALPGGADPYTNQTAMNSGTQWGSYFFVGGPTP